VTVPGLRRRLPESLAAAALVVGIAAPAAVGDGPPYAPDEALTRFRLADGFQIELVASEPDVTSPVAMDIDEDGRLFVVEMPGYPLDTRPTGRVKLLEDRDGDGGIDRSSVFAEGLVLPTGVMRWKRGILVTAAPDVLYFEDTDGDGHADVRRVILTGFARTNPQHTVNGPVFGLDNWIYLAHEGASGAIIYPDLFGDRGRPLTFPDRPDLPGVDPRNRTVRVRPETHEVEILAGRTQFGNTFDPWGRYFTSTNNDHIRHEVIAARYLERNPALALSSAQEQISDHGAAARVFPVTENPIYELLTESGEFTSACALTVYDGAAFPGDFDRSTFVAEPVHNLVHRDVLTPSGATFVAARGEPDREFLASTDAWFRPVNFYVGPDGALFVIDYYRAHIEHPEWAASEFHTDPSAFRLGSDRGRIYRVTATRMPTRERPALSSASNEALIEALSHPGGWWRRTAQRLLVDRADPRVVSRLEASARDGHSPYGRLHALWTLEGLGRLDAATIEAALEDEAAGVRENALRLAESRLETSASVRAAVIARARVETDGRARFQALTSLGSLASAEATALQAELMFAHLDDKWMQVAALSAGPDRAMSYLVQALEPGRGILERRTDGAVTFFRQTATVVARGPRPDVERAIEMVATGADAAGDWWRAAVLEGLARGLGRRDREALAPGRSQLVELASGGDAAVRRSALDLLAISGLDASASTQRAVAEAARLAADDGADAQRRADAVSLLSLDDVEARRTLFESLVDAREPEPVQVAALRALTRLEGERVGRFALERWAGLTPAARSAAIDLLLEDRSRQRLLVAALADGRVPSWTMSFWQKRDLIMNRDEWIRNAARPILEPSTEERTHLVNRYAAAVERGGDRGRGADVFARACAACHTVGGSGATELGPDLGTVRHRPPLSLLVDVLAPNQAIAQGYETYVVERTDGRSEAGTLAEQTPTTLTLRQAGQPIVIPRAEIASLTMLPQSSMPSDLDKLITPEEMADLMAFLTER
jgi:putative membrane-bound dehydrogenase-like protein